MSCVLLSPIRAAFLTRWRLSFSIERIGEGIDLELVLFNFFAGVEKKIIKFAYNTELCTRDEGRRTLRQLRSFLWMSDDDASEVELFGRTREVWNFPSASCRVFRNTDNWVKLSQGSLYQRSQPNLPVIQYDWFKWSKTGILKNNFGWIWPLSCCSICLAD